MEEALTTARRPFVKQPPDVRERRWVQHEHVPEPPREAGLSRERGRLGHAEGAAEAADLGRAVTSAPRRHEDRRAPAETLGGKLAGKELAAARHVRTCHQQWLAGAEQVRQSAQHARAGMLEDRSLALGTWRRERLLERGLELLEDSVPPALRAGAACAIRASVRRVFPSRQRMDGVDDQTWLDGAGPLVDLEAGGDVVTARGAGGAAADRLAQAVADAERDRAGAHACRAHREAGVLALSHRAKFRDPRARQQEAHRGVAHPERPQRLELLGEVEADGVAGNDRVHLLDAKQ